MSSFASSAALWCLSEWEDGPARETNHASRHPWIDGIPRMRGRERNSIANAKVTLPSTRPLHHLATYWSAVFNHKTVFCGLSRAGCSPRPRAVQCRGPIHRHPNMTATTTWVTVCLCVCLLAWCTAAPEQSGRSLRWYDADVVADESGLVIDAGAETEVNAEEDGKARKLFLSSLGLNVAANANRGPGNLKGASGAIPVFHEGQFRDSVRAKPKPGVSIPRQVYTGEAKQYLTKDAARYNDMRWGFTGYDSSFDDKTCEPLKHFVYIKTHKTGSSTLCNMVHRFAMKHNLSAALPWSNQFYAWPSLKAHDIVRATERRSPLEGPFDLLGSAHVRYQPEAFRQLLVPEAVNNVFTVLRSPASHFKSSWSYWGVANAVRSNGGPSMLSWNEFILDPEKYWKFLKPGNIDLIWNNMLFDFGLYKVRVRSAYTFA